MSLSKGKTYKDTETGVVGIAVEIKTKVPQDAKDVPPQDMALLALNREHLETGDDLEHPKALDRRWYIEARLEEVTDG